MSQGEDEKKTVRVKRRRRTEQTDERKRAEAPSRKRTDEREASTSSPPPTSYGGGTPKPPRPAARPTMPLPGGGCSPRMMMIVIGIVVIVVICGLIFNVFSDSSEPSDVGSNVPVQQVDTFETSPPTLPTTTPQPFTPPATSPDGQTWLVMLYQDADDKILEEDIVVDFNEAERVGSNDQVYIVAQVDRYSKGFQGDGNWDSTKRFYVTYDPDLNRTSSQEIADLGEANMADGETLVDFVTWAVETFPADKHVLILSDHGMGWPGGWSDHTPGGRGPNDIPLASVTGDELFLMELDEALEDIRAQTDLEKFELVGLDACLMGHVEVFDALAPHARYAVASQETEPSLGWAYTGFLKDLVNNPDMDGSDLGRLIVDSYIEEDQRIVDPQARAEFLGRGSPISGIFGMLGGMSAEQLVQQMENDVTLAAVDLGAMPELMDSLNNLSFTLQNTKQQTVAQARTYAQSFTSIFGKNVPASYIDLGNFLQLLKRESGNPDVAQAVDQVLSALDNAVIAEKHGTNKRGANGVSIYFPNSQLYSNPNTGPESYTAIANRFASESLWDDFLSFHYTGHTFEPAQGTLAVPSQGTKIIAPGAGKIEVSPITQSADVAAPGQTVILSTDISGENIGYIYFFTGFLDRASNSLFVADMDYLENDDTREVGGVYYPDWGEDEFTLEFEWEPLMFAINDGMDSELALFSPEDYGASPEEAVYTVEGIYTYADGGEQRDARLYFNNNNGLLKQVYGFSGQGGTGAPREIIPQVGDTFTVLEKWMDMDEHGKVVKVTMQEGDTLTFGEQPFEWEELDAAPGEYIVGFIVEDLDGNSFPVYTQVTVK